MKHLHIEHLLEISELYTRSDMDKNIAIEVKNLTKLYKLYDKPIDRLRDSLGLSGKKKFKEQKHEHYPFKWRKRKEALAIVQ